MRISRRLLAGVGAAAMAAAIAAAPAAAADASATKCTAYAVLKPGNEVRDEGSTDPTVESRAAGLAAVHINGTKLAFSVAIANPLRETFIAGHIHVGAAGVNGPVIVPLFTGPPRAPRLFAQAELLTIEADTAAAICGNLAGHYVNYHTTQDPQGAVRGQLVEL
jgi:hypothetical protein